MLALKILIVEDDNVSALLLKKALEKNHHEIMGIAATGEEALEIMEEVSVELVMMDINLGGELDGITTTEIINEKFDIPVVYLTASSDEETLQKIAGTNPSAYVIKPFNIRELNMMIELAIFKDKKEKELQKLNNELEEKVRQRTADLNEANKELKKALEKEREIGELKSKIVQNVSHGFKTPLTSILSSAQLLQIYSEKDHPMKGKLMKHSRKIENSVRNLNNLLTSVLFFGKADANKIDYKPSRFFTAAFFNEVIDVVKANNDKDVTLETSFKDVPKTLKSDTDLLYQVFENLLSNAVKYSKNKGKVSFSVQVNDDIMIAKIEDDGIGIPEKEQSQLFDRFFRAKNVGITEGSGLGLSIVKKCVEVLKGEISVESKAGKGSTFTVKIPIN